ncbi:MAG: hypothetical protein Q9227_003909 [Pyrenula ochraceoflavens]
MRENWVSLWARAKDQLPYVIRKRRLNFISAHYVYIASMVIIGSIIIFASGGIPYIDALFFASGASTQSGLNTVDVNKINTAQQLVLYSLAMLCNPIVIHSFVVFVRLYWFEKRFQHVVREARAFRRTKSRSRTNTMARNDVEANVEPKSVRGRNIVLLRRETSRMVNSPQEKDESPAQEQSATSSSQTRRDSVEPSDTTTHDGMPTVDEATGRQSDEVRLPQQLSPDQHIAFLENQRNPKDKLALRIPSPREYERGGKPEAIKDEEAKARQANVGTPIEPQTGNTLDLESRVRSNPPMRQHITIDEPNLPRARTRTATFSRLQSRAATQEGKEKEDTPAPMFSRSRSRRSTFSNMLRSTTDKNEDPMPYLSWEPTVGRNSMFVNLTEEQREELGGIEYRALKTLALTLTIYFFAFHLFAVLCLLPWILNSKTYGDVIRGDGIGRPWWGIFTAGSAFNDLGFTLTPDSMLNDSTVTSYPVGIRILDGLFQASATRTAGFSCVNLSDLHPAIQVSYLIMMYISVFPIAISMRRTNVYEEKSLGLYGSRNDEEVDDKEPSYVGAHLRKQLSFDLWYVFLGLFIIAIVEGDRLQNTNEFAFTLFSVLFEIVSAYGTVGLSLGYPNNNTSFSGQFRVLSKLVIIAMQIRGRHRGLPYAVDRAIILPSESHNKKEDQEGERRLRRRNSGASYMSGMSGLQRGDFGVSTGTETRDGVGDAHPNGHGTVRGGLGSAMYKLATHPEIDSITRRTSSADADSHR